MLEIPKCNWFQITNENPHYVIYCGLNQKRMMTINCTNCSKRNSQPNIQIIYEHGYFRMNNVKRMPVIQKNLDFLSTKALQKI